MNFLKQIWQTPGLKQKILFTVMALFLYRVLAQISVPGIDVDAVRSFFSSEGGGALNIYSMLTGGSFENFSIILMGLAPYINASIIMQLMQVVVPKFEALAKEGPAGQKKLSSYTRYLAVVFALAQSYGMIAYIAPQLDGSVDPSNLLSVLPLMLTVTAGTLLLMWIGELITERGLGNGISLIIFASLVSNIPSVLGNVVGSVESLAGNSGKLIPFIVFLAVTGVLILLAILATEGQRRIPVNYGTGGNSVASNIPVRILQAGMIPIIFALSLITFPSVVIQMFGLAGDENPIAQFISTALNPSSGSIYFFGFYALLILFFSFFYVAITFKTHDIAENIQKRGGFIPGYRPGNETADHLSQVSTRLNLWGGLFLAFVAILPMVFAQFSDTLTSQDLIISGSGIIIIVGVVLDLIRRINAQLVMHNYDELK